MSANDIPADDWRVIAAGVRDPDVLVQLRLAYTLGGYRMKRLILEATGPITMPDTATMVGDTPKLQWLVCEKCFGLRATVVDGVCEMCRRPPEPLW